MPKVSHAISTTISLPVDVLPNWHKISWRIGWKKLFGEEPSFTRSITTWESASKTTYDSPSMRASLTPRRRPHNSAQTELHAPTLQWKPATNLPWQSRTRQPQADWPEDRRKEPSTFTLKDAAGGGSQATCSVRRLPMTCNGTGLHNSWMTKLTWLRILWIKLSDIAVDLEKNQLVAVIPNGPSSNAEPYRPLRRQTRELWRTHPIVIEPRMQA